MNKSVAVIVSCYNHSPFIKECLDSLRRQTYKDFAVYFWDNNSSDDSYDLAEDIVIHSNEDDTYLRHICDTTSFDKVLPIGIARWYMVTEEMDEDYIAILDADDYWHMDKLSKQMELIERNPDVKLVFTDSYYSHWEEKIAQVENYPIFTEQKVYDRIDKKTFHDKYPPLMQDPFTNLLTRYNFMPCPSLLFEKKALYDVIGNPMAYTAAEDYDWVLKMTAKYDCDYVLGAPLVYYRIHEKQLTKRSPWRCTAEEIDVVKRARHFRHLTRAENARVNAHLIKLYMKLIYKELFK